MTTSDVVKHMNCRFEGLLTSASKTSRRSLELVQDEEDSIKIQRDLLRLREDCSPQSMLGEVLELEKSQNDLMEELLKIEAKLDEGVAGHELVRLQREAEGVFEEVEEMGAGREMKAEEEHLWKLAEVLQQIEEEAADIDHKIASYAYRTGQK